MTDVDVEQVLKPGYCYGHYDFVFPACKGCLVNDMCERVTKGDDEVSQAIVDKAEVAEENKKGQQAAEKVQKAPEPEVVPEPEPEPESVPEPEVVPEPEPEQESVPEPEPVEESDEPSLNDPEPEPEVFKTIDDLFTLTVLRLKDHEKVASTEEPEGKPYVFMKNAEAQKIGYVWKKDDFVLVRVGKTKDHIDVKVMLDGGYGSAMSEVEKLLDKA